MQPAVVAIAIAVAFALLAGWLWLELQKARALAGQQKAGKALDPGLEAKLEATKKELGAAREEIARKQKLLEEARDEARKKAKKEAMKAEKKEQAQQDTQDPRDVEIASLKRALSGLEQQLNIVKSDAEKRVQEARMTSENEAEQRLREVQAEAEALKQTLEELRASIKRKNEERPDVPGTRVDLKALPAEAVQELARYFRKGEEYERLYHVAQGQLQLAQDRILELQRRYYAVCRELAVAAGNADQGISDEEAKRNAEALLHAGDRIGRAAPAAPAPAATGEGTQAAGQPGEGQPGKKKRRRRRKKKPGAAAGENGAAVAAAEGDEGDEGDEGGDEGEEHEAAPAGASSDEPAAPEASEQKQDAAPAPAEG